MAPRKKGPQAIKPNFEKTEKHIKILKMELCLDLFIISKHDLYYENKNSWLKHFLHGAIHILFCTVKCLRKS